MKKTQKGFALESLLFVGVIVIVAALAVTLALTHHKKTNPPAPTSNQTSQPSNSQTQTTQKYLIVKEWGVKLPLSSPISDAYYVVSTSSHDANGQPNTAWLGVKSLDSQCSATKANQGQTPPSTLVRTAPDATDPVSGESYQQKYPAGNTLGSYYYGYLGNWSCDTNANDQAKIQSIDAAFDTAAKNIVSE